MLGGISTNICTWSGHISASPIFTPFLLHNILKIFAISCLIFPYATFLLYFGVDGNFRWQYKDLVTCLWVTLYTVTNTVKKGIPEHPTVQSVWKNSPTGIPAKGSCYRKGMNVMSVSSAGWNARNVESSTGNCQIFWSHTNITLLKSYPVSWMGRLPHMMKILRIIHVRWPCTAGITGWWRIR